MIPQVEKVQSSPDFSRIRAVRGNETAAKKQITAKHRQSGASAVIFLQTKTASLKKEGDCLQHTTSRVKSKEEK